jgi:Domain of unknown function (DUF5615)
VCATAFRVNEGDVARKRVFLDEQLEPFLKICFGRKAHVYTAGDLGVRGFEDARVIDRAVRKKCMVVTKNRDFVDYYRNHPLRKGHSVSYFYGLIFLKPCSSLSDEVRLRRALTEIAWDETRDHDDLVTVHANGSTSHERLCHEECARELESRDEMP